MCSRYRAEDGDQDDKDCTGRKGIAEECECNVLGQAFGHDARANDRRHQKGGAKHFSKNASTQVESWHQRFLALEVNWRVTLAITSARTSARPLQQSRTKNNKSA